MELAKIIGGPEQIAPNLAATTQWDAIQELVGLLVQTGRVAAADQQAVLEAVCNRETSLSTGIGHGIGIPHASSDRVREVVGVMGRSVAGIEFAAVDNQPVHLVILFLVPKDKFQEHVRTLSNIARFLNHPELRQRIETAESAAAIFDIIHSTGPT